MLAIHWVRCQPLVIYLEPVEPEVLDCRRDQLREAKHVILARPWCEPIVWTKVFEIWQDSNPQVRIHFPTDITDVFKQHSLSILEESPNRSLAKKLECSLRCTRR